MSWSCTPFPRLVHSGSQTFLQALKHQQTLDAIKHFLTIGAIEPIPEKKRRSEVYSHQFTMPKKSGDTRAILS